MNGSTAKKSRDVVSHIHLDAMPTPGRRLGGCFLLTFSVAQDGAEGFGDLEMAAESLLN